MYILIFLHFKYLIIFLYFLLVIKINNFEAYTPTNDNPIIITVYGIINPNFYEGTTTGYIRLAVRYIGSSSFLNSEQ